MERICLTNNLRVIRHAWHFYYALVLVIKVVCGSTVLRASHLNWALCKYSNQPISQCLCLRL
ncbi:TPA: DUF3265 domain-containing protein [Vibrio parahaemolyticus]|nr:DUF3265 domain-containing protein [Vibrio parahaemolyticus]